MAPSSSTKTVAVALGAGGGEHRAEGNHARARRWTCSLATKILEHPGSCESKVGTARDIGLVHGRDFRPGLDLRPAPAGALRQIADRVDRRPVQPHFEM